MIRVRAVNTAADHENKIHDDRVASEYGFRGGLVPGVTLYGYLAAGAIEHFGPDWLERGAMDVRFREPVYDGDDVTITVYPLDSGHIRIDAGAASGSAWIHNESPPEIGPEHPVQRRPATVDTLAPGTILGTLTKKLNLAESGMSAPLAPAIGPDRLAHPAILLALANNIVIDNYQLGPWIHAASEVRKFGSVRDGEELRVHGRIEDRYERKGHEFVVVNVLILAGTRVLESVRHTAIWRPRVNAIGQTR